MDFIVCRSDGSNVTVDTLHLSLLRSFAFSYSMCYHLQSLSSDVFLVSPLDVTKPHQSCFPVPLCDVLWVKSLPDVIVSLMVSSLCTEQAGFHSDGNPGKDLYIVTNSKCCQHCCYRIPHSHIYDNICSPLKRNDNLQFL